MATRRIDVPLACVLLGAAALRGWGIGYGLPHTLTRPDEEAVFAVALRVFGGNFDPGFFDWPSLFMYAVAAAFVLYFNIGRIAGWFGREAAFVAAAIGNPAPLFLVARGISAAAGTATVATVFRIAGDLFDRSTAIVAAAFLAVAALHVRESHFALTDVAATWLLTLSFLFTVRYARAGRQRDAILSAVWAGLAISTKYNAGVVALPALWAIVSRERRGAAVRVAVMYGLVMIAAFAAGTPYAFLDARQFAASLVAVSAHLRNGHIIVGGYAWRIHLTSSLRYGVGLPMLLAGIAGFALSVVRDRHAGLLFALFPVAYFALIGAGQTAFARYIMPILPFLCIAAAHTTVEGAGAVARMLKRPGARPKLTWALAILVAAPTLWSSIATDRLLSLTDSRLQAAGWIRDNFPHGASMFQTGAIYGHIQMQRSGFIDDPAYSPVPVDAPRPPDLIVVLRCPLAYCDTPPDLEQRLLPYMPLQTFTAVNVDDPALVYDREDAFFVPLSGFGAVTRPGPNVLIYERLNHEPATSR